MVSPSWRFHPPLPFEEASLEAPTAMSDEEPGRDSATGGGGERGHAHGHVSAALNFRPQGRVCELTTRVMEKSLPPTCAFLVPAESDYID